MLAIKHKPVPVAGNTGIYPQVLSLKNRIICIKCVAIRHRIININPPHTILAVKSLINNLNEDIAYLKGICLGGSNTVEKKAVKVFPGKSMF